MSLSMAAERDARDREARERLGLPLRTGEGEYNGAHSRQIIRHGTIQGYRAELRAFGKMGVCEVCREACRLESRERLLRPGELEKVRERSRRLSERRKTDPEFAERLRVRERGQGRRKRNNPEYRARENEKRRVRRRLPGVLEGERLAAQQRRAEESPERREARLAARRERYRNEGPEARERRKRQRRESARRIRAQKGGL